MDILLIGLLGWLSDKAEKDDKTGAVWPLVLGTAVGIVIFILTSRYALIRVM